MRRPVLVIAASIAGVMALGGGIAAGCGDKFVLIGGGARINRSKYPSRVLVFMNPSSRIPAAEKEFHVEAMLTAAGHKATIVESEAEVRKALESGKFDLVLADLADVADIRARCGAIPSKPAVLPILYKPTAAELSGAEKEANCALRPSKKNSDLLTVIDETMKDRRDGVAAHCKTTP